jgi:hypothetical protein
MEKKLTAVEWLIIELGEYFPHEIGGIHLMVKKAKEMEEKQTIEFADEYNFQFMSGSNKSVKEFFNKQFKNK